MLLMSPPPRMTGHLANEVGEENERMRYCSTRRRLSGWLMNSIECFDRGGAGRARKI